MSLDLQIFLAVQRDRVELGIDGLHDRRGERGVEERLAILLAVVVAPAE